MAYYVSETLEDGSTVVGDNANPNTTYVLKKGQWEQVQAVKADQQRRILDRFKEQNEADPTGGRTEIDEQTMDFARDSSSGEAHQESERGD